MRSAMGRRRGFNFTEVLFAVMILGVGFVMVAAMFPVTIRQTALTMEEAAGANTAKDAIQALQSIAVDPASGSSMSSDQAFPPTGGKFMPVSQRTMDTAWKWACRSNSISAQNPRYGWVAMYKRDQDSPNRAAPYAQVIVIAAQSRNRPQYYINDAPGVLSDVRPPPPAAKTPYSALEPRQVKVDVERSAAGLSTVRFFDGGQFVAAPGAYLVIGDDKLPAPATASSPGPGFSNGRIYQLGNPVTDNDGNATDTFELVPGGDMIKNGVATDDPPLKGAVGYLLGRGYTDPFNGVWDYSGPAQDIGVYVSFIRVMPTIDGP